MDSKYKDYTTFMQREPPSNMKQFGTFLTTGCKKPEKLRVAFNCSADFQGHPLNRHLPQGPDLTNSLVSVLCHFRQEPVAFACDIVGMFHQVHVNEKHCDLLCFLCLEQGDTSKKPTEYRMTVHRFGATSSPGCANLALRTAANDGVNEFGVEAASFIKENFFVDDGLKTVTAEPEVIVFDQEQH